MNGINPLGQFCAIRKAEILGSPLDLATLFFRDIFGEGAAPKAMAALIAFSIFGNLVVSTFTASRGMVTSPGSGTTSYT